MVSSLSSLGEFSSSRIRSWSRSGVARAAHGARDRARLHAAALDAHEHFRRGAGQLLVAELEQELVRARAALLDAAEQLCDAALEARREGLAEDDLVVIAALHPLADALHLGHVLFRLVVADDIRRRGCGRRGHFLAGARQAQRAQPFEIEVVLEPLDDLLLAVHEADVVAEEQPQVLLLGARQAQADGVELEQQVVAEGPDQGQAGVARVAELLHQRAQNGEERGLFGALLFGKQRRKRLQAPAQRPPGQLQRLPVRVRAKNVKKHFRQHLSAQVQRAEFDFTAGAGDLQRRIHAGDVPARIPLRVLVAGRKVEAAAAVQLPQQPLQPLAEGQAGAGARDSDAMRRGVAKNGHPEISRVASAHCEARRRRAASA
jgi:hypothetical protein